ncbi:hypothetical protein [Nocardia testacea]|uniref:hypothetical protein n=1 Tax=Nocardia testacea TaxID=248551 RepID=UPI0003049537|nr:hypothetical protein [Nocardia testacea]
MFSVFRRGRSRRPQSVTAAVCAVLAAAGTALIPGSTAMAAPTAAAPTVTVYPGMEIRHTEIADGKAVTTRCTVGLTGSIGSAQYAVTAGHCYHQGIVTDKVGNPIGWFETHRPDEGLKFGFGLIRLYDGIGVAASMGRFGLSTVDMKPQLGQEICKIGATTGWTCGSITEANEDWLYATNALGAEAGDSGGVVYRQTADGHAAFVGILVAYDDAQGRSAVVEPAALLFDQIDRYGPTREDPFIWYRV